MLWGLSLGLSRQLLEKQLNLSIGAAVASAIVGTRKATRAQPSPLGEAGTADGTGEGAHVVGWAYDHAGLRALARPWGAAPAGPQSRRQVEWIWGRRMDCICYSLLIQPLLSLCLDWHVYS